MNIAFVASESNPYCKTGGLADVVFALAKELTKKGQNVIVVLPFYDTIRKKNKFSFEHVCDYEVRLSWRRQSASVYRSVASGVPFYLIENDYYFDRGDIYGFNDDGERFAFFSLAARDLFAHLGFAPDIIHVHDWQAGMLPVLIQQQNQGDPLFAKTKFVMTIHNPEFKGLLDKYFLGDFYNLSDSVYDSGLVRYGGMVSTLKAGIMASEKVTTVAPTYRNEMLTPEGGRGLDGALHFRESDFVGILNGVDTDEFDPEHDPSILPFGLKDFTEGKAKNKAKFLKEHGLEDDGSPLYGLVSRLTSQKGISLVANVARELLNQGAELFVVGSGEYDLEQALQHLRDDYPTRMGVYFGYNGELAHQVYASSDFFLMPSLFEPCGIGQMIAERYGSLPIVRDTGGLHDTVFPYGQG